MSQRRTLKGLAFEIADLVRIQGWAAQNAVRMDIRLDHGVEGEEYEEVIAFRTDATACFLLMWPDAGTPTVLFFRVRCPQPSLREANRTRRTVTAWQTLVHLVGSGDSVGPFSEPSRICHSFTETAISTLSAIGVNPTGMRVDPL
jgi:hypothetical protein